METPKHLEVYVPPPRTTLCETELQTAKHRQGTRQSVNKNDAVVKTFPFMKLHPELRNNVYEYALTAPSASLTLRNLKLGHTWGREGNYAKGYDADTIRENLALGLMRVCKPVNMECWAVLYRCNTFVFFVENCDRIIEICEFILGLSERIQQSIRSIKLICDVVHLRGRDWQEVIFFSFGFFLQGLTQLHISIRVDSPEFVKFLSRTDASWVKQLLRMNTLQNFEIHTWNCNGHDKETGKEYNMVDYSLDNASPSYLHTEVVREPQGQEQPIRVQQEVIDEEEDEELTDDVEEFEEAVIEADELIELLGPRTTAEAAPENGETLPIDPGDFDNPHTPEDDDMSESEEWCTLIDDYTYRFELGKEQCYCFPKKFTDWLQKKMVRKSRRVWNGDL